MEKLIFQRKIPLKTYLALLVCIPICLQAQSIKRQSISCFGSTLSANGSVVQQTVGQPYSTVAFYENKTSVLQGFQQPSVFKVENITPPDNTKSLKLDVYPNPAYYSINIQSEEVIENSVIRIVDMNGKLVMNEQVAQLQTYSINCETWTDGTYIITVSDNNQNKSSLKLIINK